jgi:hypothetical protein
VSAGPSTDGLLVGLAHRALVEVDVACELEDALDRRRDVGFEVDPHHVSEPDM